MPTGRKQSELVSFSFTQSDLVFYYHLNFFLVPTLLTKLKRSETGLDSTKPAFEQLTNSCLERKLPVKSWRKAEQFAMEKRGEALRIFDVKHQKAATMAQITLQLTDTSDNSNNHERNMVNWISDGIKAENDQ